MELKLIKKIKESENINTYIFKPDSDFKWMAGQYLIYSLTHKNQDNRGKMRFFTISSSPFQKYPSITTRIDKINGSSFKKALDLLKIGDEINIKGPDGDFVINDFKKSYVFIAGGIGITPFRSILGQLNHKNLDLNIVLLYSGKNNSLVFKKDLESLKLKKLKIKYFDKRINKTDIEKIKDFKKRIFYISGPDAMIEDIEKMLLEIGLKKENIKSDYFSGY